MMKKVLAAVFVAVMLAVCAVSVNAVNVGDVVNMTVYTDIVAKINTQDIASYNVDGYTVVVAEDLREYGFNVVWSQAERALYITKAEGNPMVTSTYVSPKISASKAGKKAFDVLYSDIKTYMDGELVTSYNIGGRTVIYFQDLTRYGAVSYNDSIRTLSAEFSWLRGPAVWYSSSMYRVGYDIPAGDYYAVATDSRSSGYYCKFNDSTHEDIEDNDVFSNFTFLRCYDGQYLKLSRCKITPIENAPVNSSSTGVYGEGKYRVGIDMPAGEYKFTATDGNGYYCAFTDITYKHIENNDVFEDVTYYSVKNGQYLKLSRCTAVCIKPDNTPVYDNTSGNSSDDNLIYVGMDKNSTVSRNVRTLKSAIIKNGQRTSGGYGFTQSFGSAKLSLMYLNEGNVCTFLLQSSSNGAEMTTTLYLFEDQVPSVSITYGGQMIFVANYKQPQGTMEVIEATVDESLCREVVDTAFIAYDEFIDMLEILYPDFEYIDLEDFGLGI